MTPADSRNFWERNATRYDASTRWVAKPLPRMVALVGEAVAGLDEVLEAAAGTGIVTAAIARSARAVVATDYAAAMVEVLVEKAREAGISNVTFEQADIENLPFDTGRFDAAVAANVLHLVPDVPRAIASLARVVKPGGKIVVPTFLHDETLLAGVVSRLLALTGFPGRRRFRSRSLREAVESAGLRVDRFEVIPGPIPIGYLEGRVTGGSTSTDG